MFVYIFAVMHVSTENMQVENLKLMVKIMKKKAKICDLSILDLVCLQHEQMTVNVVITLPMTEYFSD